MENLKKSTYFWNSDICVAKSHRYIWNICGYFTLAYQRKKLISGVKWVYTNSEQLFGSPSLWEQSICEPSEGSVR